MFENFCLTEKYLFLQNFVSIIVNIRNYFYMSHILVYMFHFCCFSLSFNELQVLRFLLFFKFSLLLIDLSAMQALFSLYKREKKKMRKKPQYL